MNSYDTASLPTPDDLERAPELPVMAVLDSALEMTAYTLQVAHPELVVDAGHRSGAPPCVSVAEGVLHLIDRLREALSRYRASALDRRPSSLQLYDPDDLPF
jgi:hypothetical protein